jgi:hypothetical protein
VGDGAPLGARPYGRAKVVLAGFVDEDDPLGAAKTRRFLTVWRKRRPDDDARHVVETALIEAAVEYPQILMGRSLCAVLSIGLPMTRIGAL